jgi:hypothetical protein
MIGLEAALDLDGYAAIPKKIENMMERMLAKMDSCQENMKTNREKMESTKQKLWQG